MLPGLAGCREETGLTQQLSHWENSGGSITLNPYIIYTLKEAERYTLNKELSTVETLA